MPGKRQSWGNYSPRKCRSGWVPPTRDRVRWLPWQARTASWQAAYNTACLYAVLLQQDLADEEQVIAGLRRLVNNRDSGLERPHDWISNDPDFAPLLHEGSAPLRQRQLQLTIRKKVPHARGPSPALVKISLVNKVPVVSS